MKIVFIAGMAPITKDPSSSRKLYLDTLGLPLKAMDDYLSVNGFEGAKHFAVWPLRHRFQSTGNGLFFDKSWYNTGPEAARSYRRNPALISPCALENRLTATVNNCKLRA